MHKELATAETHFLRSIQPLQVLMDIYVRPNGREAKASYDVKIGDVIDISFGSRRVSVRVLDIRETTKKSESVGMYEIVGETDA